MSPVLFVLSSTIMVIKKRKSQKKNDYFGTETDMRKISWFMLFSKFSERFTPTTISYIHFYMKHVYVAHLNHARDRSHWCFIT
jgi:hypothetical protein